MPMLGRWAIATFAFAIAMGAACADSVPDCLGERPPEETIKNCTILLDMWKGPTGKSSDKIVPVFFATRAWAHIHTGQFDKALPDVEAAIKLEPNYADAYALRARFYVEKTRPDLALKDIDKVFKLLAEQKQEPQAEEYYIRGRAYELAGDKGRAHLDYRQVLVFDAAHSGANEGRNRLNAADAALKVCEAGTPAKVKGTILEVVDTIVLAAGASEICQIQYVTPKGDIPPECNVGADITASGKITHDYTPETGETSYFLEELDQLNCIPEQH